MAKKKNDMTKAELEAKVAELEEQVEATAAVPEDQVKEYLKNLDPSERGTTKYMNTLSNLTAISEKQFKSASEVIADAQRKMKKHPVVKVAVPKETVQRKFGTMWKFRYNGIKVELVPGQIVELPEPIANYVNKILGS